MSDRMTDALTAGIVVFDDVDLLDVVGPYEVLLTASRLAARDHLAQPFIVQTLGLTDEPAEAYGGAGIRAGVRLDQSRVDLLIVPGAIAIDEVLADRDLVRAIGAASAAARVTASVCTGAFLLGELGLLTGRRWTTHWEDIDELASRLGMPGERNVRWVDEGEIVTSGAVSSGVAMTLHLVHRFAGLDLAQRSARQLDYLWIPEPAITAPGAG
jgi:transcriptional regulator GlxA family with amidase domain